MSTLSTHVLDTALGRPAAGIPVTLEGNGTLLGSGVTDADGRVANLLAPAGSLRAGPHRLTFSVGEYFSKAGRAAFYTDIVVQFQVADGAERYHIPLLLGPFGYTTYRGS